MAKKDKQRKKVNWWKEWSASICIKNIREILDTYWDEDYQLYKIGKEIEKFTEKMNKEDLV